MTEMERELSELAAARSRQTTARAAGLLGHYLQQAWSAAGLTWTSDNDAEVTEIVDLIVEAARCAGA